jgi:uncharacterized protein YbbC (DUF1343 family)
VEGFLLEPGWESFVGAAPIPMRHGLTLGELALYYKKQFALKVDLQVVKMKGYKINRKPEKGWTDAVPWVNPSPNAASLNMARCYAGTVLIEGTNLSEGRGTTKPLEIVGDPEIEFSKIRAELQKRVPQLLKGALVRELFFEPTFYKHQGKLCSGLQFHTDFKAYSAEKFKPVRLMAMIFKLILEQKPKYPLFRDFAYEYVFDKLAFNVINGGPKLKDWICDQKSIYADLDRALKADEAKWKKQRKEFLLYR